MTEDTQFETMGLQATSPPTSPLHRMPPFLKRKHDNLEEEDLMPSSPPHSPEDLQSTSTITSPDGSKRLRVNDDDKENVDNVKSIVISAKKSIPPPPVLGVQEEYSGTCSSSSTSSTTSSEDNDDSGIRDISEDDYLAANEEEEEEDEEDEKSEEEDEKPKVIVEHQPLPSIYELQQMTCENLNESNLDSGLSEDESGSDPEEDSEEESVESMISSPLFDPVLRGTPSKTPIITPPTPKVIYNDRFWNQGSFGAQNTPQPPATPPPHSSQSQGGSPGFGFLESGQRIECAENGKSYLQLGTINHIPVTPVIQPKSNMVYRRPIPPFRTPPGGSQVHLQAARPVCDHSDCLQRKSSYCYKNQRSRMLNLSLHKLHLARQNHEGCLRRSVLICNMLRYIEDENEKEALQETLVPQQMETNEQYWPSQPQSCSSGPVTTGGTPLPLVSSVTSSAYMQPQAPTPQAPAGNGSSDTYETALKDFNTAFRSTPYTSPLHPSSDSDMSGTTDVGLSLSLTSTSSTVTPTSASEERSTGINWGSVLSLGSQSELDPLNNNSFNTEVSSWSSVSSSSSSVTTSAISSGPAVSSTTSTTLTTLSPLTGVTESGEDLVHSFVDDIGWKLSADDVLKAFPT